MSVFLSEVLERALPFEVDEVVGRILGTRIAAEDGHFRIVAWGRFGGHLTGALLALAGNPKTPGALIVADEEAERVFYLREGVILGSSSNVLFEQLGRVLYQAEVVTHEDSETLIEVEESEGEEALVGWLSDEVLAWAAGQRVESVAAALPYIRKGHFLWVEGEPDLQGLPLVALEPGKVAAEASRLYEVWRHGETASIEALPLDVPAPLPGPVQPPRGRQEEVDDIFRRIRDADLGFK